MAKAKRKRDYLVSQTPSKSHTPSKRKRTEKVVVLLCSCRVREVCL